MEKKEIAELFMKGIDCSQVVVGAFAEELGITTEEAYKMSAAFGGGMGLGETCGAVVGAMIVLGLKYGHWDVNTLLRQKEEMMNKYAEFRALFLEKFATNSCKELLGYDVSLPEQFEEALSSGRMLDFCPKVVESVIEILEEIL